MDKVLGININTVAVKAAKNIGNLKCGNYPAILSFTLPSVVILEKWSNTT